MPENTLGHQHQHLKWFGDNSELNGVKESEIPDILIIGGIIVDLQAEIEIKSSVERIKAAYADPRAPIKWNMKDLARVYAAKGMQDYYDGLMKTSRDWRQEIFTALARSQCTLLVSCTEGYSAKRSVLKGTKEGLTRYSFTNALMRFALHVQEKKPTSASVVLDWPDKGNPLPFDSEYANAYVFGSTTENIKYHSGKLSALNFADSIMFTNMLHCTLLQVADMVVGATRQFVECCLEKKEGGQGLDCLKLVRDRFRGAPYSILQRGIVVSSGNAELTARVKNGIQSILYS